ncbi:HNH endonuclease [Streptomyces phaeofaciens]|uniref:HNH endonuclease n=1 Tax=Streptomyces phaeofaciens TaxID=68254 RepID=UPI00167AE523
MAGCFQHQWRPGRRDGFQCLACDSEDDLTTDHIQRQSAGGQHGIENLRTPCCSCKAPRLVTAPGTALQARPRPPQW